MTLTTVSTTVLYSSILWCVLFAERIFLAILVRRRHITRWHHHRCWTRQSSSISSTLIHSSSSSTTWRYDSARVNSLTVANQFVYRVSASFFLEVVVVNVVVACRPTSCSIEPVCFLAGWHKGRPEPGFKFVRFSFAYLNSCHQLLLRCQSVVVIFVLLLVAVKWLTGWLAGKIISKITHNNVEWDIIHSAFIVASGMLL